MKALKVFVGLDGKFVLCEKFPKDEEHAGLHDMLEDLMGDNIEVTEPMGFYHMHFEMAPSLTYYDDPTQILDINKLEPIQLDPETRSVFSGKPVLVTGV